MIRVDNCPSNVIVPKLLSDTLLRPELALYVKQLKLDYWAEWWEDNDEVPAHIEDPEKWLEDRRLVWHAPYPASDMAMYKQALDEGGPELKPELTIEEWKAMLDTGDQDPLVVLLLTRLPNFQKLLFIETPTRSRILQVIHDISKTHNSSMLKYLKAVVFSGDNTAYGEEVSLLKPFAMLPLVREIACEQLIEKGNGHFDYIDCNPRSQTSNVMLVTLADCVNIAKDLSILLEGFDKLKSFKYIAKIPDDENEISDPFWIRSALSSSRQSLESLVMRFSSISDEAEENLQCMGSLRRFAALTFLEVDYHLLVDTNKGKRAQHRTHATSITREASRSWNR